MSMACYRDYNAVRTRTLSHANYVHDPLSVTLISYLNILVKFNKCKNRFYVAYTSVLPYRKMRAAITTEQCCCRHRGMGDKMGVHYKYVRLKAGFLVPNFSFLS